MTKPTIKDYLRDYQAATRSAKKQHTDSEGNVNYAALYRHTSGVLFGLLFSMAQHERRLLTERFEEDERWSRMGDEEKAAVVQAARWRMKGDDDD